MNVMNERSEGVHLPFSRTFLRRISPAVAAVWIEAMREQDDSTCPYYQGTGDQVCDRGCREEPRCMVDEPLEGWPLVRAGITRRRT